MLLFRMGVRFWYAVVQIFWDCVEMLLLQSTGAAGAMATAANRVIS